MQHEVVGHEEREVGPAARTFEGALALVVHAFDEAREAQDVLGHALAPLPAHLGAHERLAQALRALAQLVHAFSLAGQLAAQRAELALAVGLELAHELTDLLDLMGDAVARRRELPVDERLLALELRARAGTVALEQRAVQLLHLVDRGLDRRVAALFAGPALFFGEAAHLTGERRVAGPSREQRPTHEPARTADHHGEHEQHGDHRMSPVSSISGIVTGGCDTHADGGAQIPFAGARRGMASKPSGPATRRRSGPPRSFS